MPRLCIRKLTVFQLIHFMPLILSINPKNITKSQDFWYIQEVLKRTNDVKWVNFLSVVFLELDLEAYLELCQASIMGLLCKNTNGFFRSWLFLQKSLNIYVWQGFNYASNLYSQIFSIKKLKNNNLVSINQRWFYHIQCLLVHKWKYWPL